MSTHHEKNAGHTTGSRADREEPQGPQVQPQGAPLAHNIASAPPLHETEQRHAAARERIEEARRAVLKLLEKTVKVSEQPEATARRMTFDAGRFRHPQRAALIARWAKAMPAVAEVLGGLEARTPPPERLKALEWSSRGERATQAVESVAKTWRKMGDDIGRSMARVLLNIPDTNALSGCVARFDMKALSEALPEQSEAHQRLERLLSEQCRAMKELADTHASLVEKVAKTEWLNTWKSIHNTGGSLGVRGLLGGLSAEEGFDDPGRADNP